MNSKNTTEIPYTTRSDIPFYVGLVVLSSVYIILILAMIIADASFTTLGDILEALRSPDIRYSIRLSLISSSITTLLSLWASIPLAYLMSRFRFPGKAILESILDIPIVLPPLVVGLSLLILFTTPLGNAVESIFYNLTGSRITYAIPAVILAQFMVACAFAVRTMRATFDEINPRREQVAQTLGASRGQAFWLIALPEARQGVVVAATLAWARSLGEFGPILIFAGATRMHTEVMPTTVFLRMSVGDIEAAVAVSILMIFSSFVVLGLVRVAGQEKYVR